MHVAIQKAPPKGKTAAPAKGKAVVETKEPSKALATRVVDKRMLAMDGAEDMNFRKDDLAIPFLRILQSGSPQAKKSDPQYVEGAEEGFFFNTLTKEVWDGGEGVLVVPVAYTPSYTEWTPRDEGGGFVKDHGSDDSVLKTTTRNEKNKDMTPDGTEITRAGMYYIFIVDPVTGAFQQAVLSLSSTQLKKSRAWNSVISTFRAPDPDTGIPMRVAPFFMAYQCTSIPEQKDDFAWMGINIEPFKQTLELPNGEDIYLAAREFKKQVASGTVRVKHETLVDAEPAGADSAF